MCFCYVNMQAQVSSKYSKNLIDYREVIIDIDQLKSTLQSSQMKGTVAQNRRSNIVVELPSPKGGLNKFRVIESPILSPKLSATRPDVKSYIAKGIDDSPENGHGTHIGDSQIQSIGLLEVLEHCHSGCISPSALRSVEDFVHHGKFVCLLGECRLAKSSKFPGPGDSKSRSWEEYRAPRSGFLPAAGNGWVRG